MPRIYDRLAAERDVVLAEFPFYSGAIVHLNGPYVLANTRYFQPLVNGYSGFQTAAYETRAHALDTFPSSLALAELQALGVTHVTVHQDQFRRRHGEAALAAIDAVMELVLIAEDDGIRLYRLTVRLVNPMLASDYTLRSSKQSTTGPAGDRLRAASRRASRNRTAAVCGAADGSA